MEMKIGNIQLPEKISFNYEEIKAELVTRLENYKSLVYTDDQITDAKKDRASLNNLKKMLNSARIDKEKEYMKPFEEFKSQVKELCDLIDGASKVIDERVKAYEEEQKATKENEIREYWQSLNVPEWMHFYDTKWLNASVSMPSIKKLIDESIQLREKDLAVIRDLPEYAFEAEEVYHHTFSLADAIAEAHELKQMAQRKLAFEEARKKAEKSVTTQAPAEEEVQDDEPPFEVDRKWIGFEAFLSSDEAARLGKFLKEQRIQYRAIRK